MQCWRGDLELPLLWLHQWRERSVHRVPRTAEPTTIVGTATSVPAVIGTSIITTAAAAVTTAAAAAAAILVTSIATTTGSTTPYEPSSSFRAAQAIAPALARRACTTSTAAATTSTFAASSPTPPASTSTAPESIRAATRATASTATASAAKGGSHDLASAASDGDKADAQATASCGTRDTVLACLAGNHALKPVHDAPNIATNTSVFHSRIHAGLHGDGGYCRRLHLRLR